MIASTCRVSWLLPGSVPISSLSSTPTMQTELLSSRIFARSLIGASPAGRNIGRLTSSVSFSKQTSTGMSQRICLGSGAMPTRLVRMRGPSSSSTIASTTGVFTLNALFKI